MPSTWAVSSKSNADISFCVTFIASEGYASEV